MAKCTVLVITAVTKYLSGGSPPPPLSQGLDDRPVLSEVLDPPLYLYINFAIVHRA